MRRIKKITKFIRRLANVKINLVIIIYYKYLLLSYDDSEIKEVIRIRRIVNILLNTLRVNFLIRLFNRK